ncbi:MAG: sugar ABC transporter substrate-binding protein [Spirochaetaceae bacterium]|nr:sugar ABC transporter substrate-binding protein [Spirochaetaceae bacterium]
MFCFGGYVILSGFDDGPTVRGGWIAVEDGTKRFLGLTLLCLAGFLSCAKEKVVTLNYLEVMTNPARTEALRGIIAKYQAAHPGIKINLISPPYEQADNRLERAFASKEALDIVEIRDITASRHVAHGRLTDLTPYLAEWPEAKTLLPVAVEMAKVADGKPYFIPQFFYIPALYVRTDVLSRLGVTVLPDTIDGLFALCKQITNQQAGQYGFAIRGKANPFRPADLLILSNVNNVNPDNLYRLKDGTSVFHSPEYLAAFIQYVDLFQKAVPQDGVNWGFSEQLHSFAAGTTPFLMQDPDAVPVIDKQITRDQFTVVPMPVGRSDCFYYEPGFAGFGIPEYSPNKDAAWDFIAFISSAAQNGPFNKAYGALPVHSTSYEEDPYFCSGIYQAWAAMMADPVKYAVVHYPYSAAQYPGWAQVHEDQLRAAFLKEITPAKAVQVYEEYWK